MADLEAGGRRLVEEAEERIREYGEEDTTVIAASFVRQDAGWDLFTAVECHNAGDLYPYRYEPVNWD